MNSELKEFKTYDEYLNWNYYLHFKKFWIPILRKQIFLAKFSEDTDTLLSIKENIYRNDKLVDYRENIINELGIKYLHSRKKV